nr:ribonuclease H [Ipomoea batatas]
MGGKARRANVIANENQIENEPTRPHSGTVTGKEPTQGRRHTGSSSRRAAEEDEHVVIRGAQGGKVISSTTVPNGETNMGEIPEANHPVDEHHGDPPGAIDAEGDVIMDITMQQKESMEAEEPKVSGAQVNVICSKLGFSDWIRVENQEAWYYAVVYGSPTHNLRRRMWSELTATKREITGAWMVAGDFNSVTSRVERYNYTTFNSQRSSDFVEWIQNEGLIDMGCGGPSHTWVKGGTTEQAKGARLDRALCNLAWRQRFPEAIVTHLPRLSSDHAPLLICLIEGSGDHRRAGFKFQAAWLTSPQLSEVVRTTWRKGTGLQDNIARMTAEFTKWNKEVFGNIKHRKNVVLTRLGGIQKSLSTRHHGGLVKHEKRLTEEYHEILYQEELMWFQHSREDWIVSGDRNTAYYHAVATIKKAQNKVQSEILKAHVRRYYINMFTSEEESLHTSTLEGSFPRLTMVDWTSFNSAISKEEVYGAVMDMAPFKSPGPDGYHVAFYQHMWGTVGENLFDLVNQAYQMGSLPEGLNDTLLVLIPKVRRPENIKQFRPISLCNVSYKVITKTITNRLKVLLPKIVSPFQSSFVPGRQITDNVFIYQEVMHTMRKKRGPHGIMAIKLDLEKAYDRLSWTFIRSTLHELGFTNSWVNLIMQCVETPRMSIIWNGDRL